MDADRKKYTFKNWYEPMYKENSSIIWDLFDFNNLEYKNGYQITLRKDIDISKFDNEKKERINDFEEKNQRLLSNNFFPFRLSGDADFQVYDENKNKKKEMHMLPNFSLIPVTGALNNIKGRKNLSCFLKDNLKGYYEKKDIKNLPYRRMGRSSSRTDAVIQLEKEALKSFLDIFDNINEYCNNLYFLNYNAILKLDHKEYWNERIKIAKECDICESQMDKDIDLPEYK